MSEETGSQSVPTDPVGRVLYKGSRILAIFGGTLLFLLAAMMSISIAGRFFFSAPVPGDFELVEIGTGLAIFAFLPYCQLMRGNVLVDFFMNFAPRRVQTFCDSLGALIYVLIGALLTWRMIFGGFDMYDYGEKSLTINFPRWTTFPVSVLFMAWLVVVTVYTVGRSVAETKAGRSFDR